MPSRSDALIVGGGAAGLLCAGAAASWGRRVLVLEKMERPARKVGLTGKGRCNLTNDCDRDSFLAAVRGGSRFLYSAYSAFSPQDAMSLFESLGVPLKTERGGRVFPRSDQAMDIVDALVRYAKQAGASIVREEAASLLIENGAAAGVRCESGKCCHADHVVIATGGLSYPATGSTGDGYRFAEQAGHTVIPTRGSLIPIETAETWPRDAMGLSLRNVALTLTKQGEKKPLFSERGEMLFTHFGVSGPLALSASAHMDGNLSHYLLHIDLKPALDHQALDARLLRDFEENRNRDLINVLGALLPRKLIMPVILLSGLAPGRKIHQITREERREFGALLKDLTLRPKQLRPVEEAVVTAGGVKLGEVNPKTMESKCLPGLFFAGEVLDLDAYTGGYNLQIAFSTGFLAGQSI